MGRCGVDGRFPRDNGPLSVPFAQSMSSAVEDNSPTCDPDPGPPTLVSHLTGRL